MQSTALHMPRSLCGWRNAVATSSRWGLVGCFLALFMATTACDSGPGGPPPQAPPSDFSVVGETIECRSCGDRAADLCANEGPGVYPTWFGFDSSGTCVAECSNQLQLLIGGPRGLERSACSYQITLDPGAIEDVCPSNAPSTGDRELDGHGPMVSGAIFVEPSRAATGGIETRVDLIFSEVDRSTGRPAGDRSSLRWIQTLTRARLSTSGGSPPPIAGSSQAVAVRRIVSPASGRTRLSRLMMAGTETFVAPGDGDGLIERLVIDGDTFGDDFSTDLNCNDDTRIVELSFRPVRVEVGP